MGHKRNKKHTKPNKGRLSAEEVAGNWAWAEMFGAIVPDYVPDCPDCDDHKRVSGRPYTGTGLFFCFKCEELLVVLEQHGEEVSVMLDDLADTAENPFEGEAKPTNVYDPTDLVEEGDALLVG